MFIRFVRQYVMMFMCLFGLIACMEQKSAVGSLASETRTPVAASRVVSGDEGGALTADTAPPTAVTLPTHTKTCRSPADPDCAQCRYETEAGCAYLQQSNPTDASWKGVEPWYNMSVPGSCSDTKVLPCDSCLKRAETELKNILKTHPKLDCSKTPELFNPCVNEDSLECTCYQFKRLSESCPEVLKKHQK